MHRKRIKSRPGGEPKIQCSLLGYLVPQEHSVTDKGQGRVLHHEILARRILIEFEDGRRLPVPVDEVLTRL